MRALPDAIATCRSWIPAEVVLRLQPLFLSGDLRQRLAMRLLVYARQGVPARHPLPTFAGECTPPLAEAYAFFKDAIAHAIDFPTDPSLTRRLADSLAHADSLHVLVLLGMRLTPASVTDERGFPPPRQILLDAATAGEGLSPAGRALDKHAPRNAGRWGKPAGSVEDKNENASGLVERILDEATWWNVFGHHKHGLVYEAREPAGHGAALAHHGADFIGFLEPFSEEEEP